MKIAAFGVALLLVGTAPAQEWSRFRGPRGQGHASTTGLAPDAEHLEVRWERELPGRGHASAVLWGDHLFTTWEEAEPQRRGVIALDKNTGKVEWNASTKFAPHGQHRLNSFASSTPSVAANGVYVAWTSGTNLEVRAWDREGKPLWTRNLGAFSVNHGSGSSPVLVDGVLLVGKEHEGEGGSAIYGLNPENGETVWERERDTTRGSYATPITWSEEGRTVALFTGTSHGLSLFDVKSGELRWEKDGIFTQRCVGSPVRAGELLVQCAGSGGGGKEIAIFERPDQDGEFGAPPFRISRSLPYVPTPIAVDELLFLWNESGIVTCIRIEDGKALWSERLDARFYSSPIHADGALWSVSLDGELVAIDASKVFRVRLRKAFDEASSATLAADEKHLYLRTESHMRALR